MSEHDVDRFASEELDGEAWDCGQVRFGEMAVWATEEEEEG